MINSSTIVFPNNALELIKTRLEAKIDPDETDPLRKVPIYRRPVRPTDGIQAIGLFPRNWVPLDDSREVGKREPTLQRYMCSIQCFVKDADELKAIADHGIMSEIVRSTLYNDNPLWVGLGALSATMDGKVKTFKRLEQTGVRYLNNEIQGSFVYMSTVDFYVETETT